MPYALDDRANPIFLISTMVSRAEKNQTGGAEQN
jgi:hypothetical protein